MTRVVRVLGAIAPLLAVLAGPAGAGPLDHPGYPKAFACSACHGLGGASLSEAVPVLAGMDAAYFKKAIEDYAAGRRPSPEMEPFAKQVQVLGLDDVAAYFAAQRWQPTPVRVDRAAAERGRAASAQCATCHGADGRGDPAKRVPPLAGQAPGYLRNQMVLFKTDRRSPGDEALTKMKAIMKGLSDETIADLAAYYAGLR